MTKDEQLKVLEAVLFATNEPLSPKALHERLPEEADLNMLLQDLKAQYEGRGVSLIEVDGHWAFRTSSEIAEILTIEKDVNKKMSRAMLETMAIIAYHQPLTRAEIENIRGVATHRGTLDTLMEMEWVKPGRRRETPGRPLTWVTTTKFLDHFQLEQINDLPGLEDLKASGLLDKRPAIDTIPDTGDLFDSADQSAEEMLAEQEKRDQMDSDDRFEDDITNAIISGSNDLGEEEDV
ncbi:MAG: SMC-Scp complex subunit ScpB [Alphaproteobacteria bacterium]|nr:SMC-Scp complex subunit ScpB [Alphaproteobacteria bacterium]NCQ89099.1 SMC-Scp complex subunit ScpB [Alphaproteobacteria bacterium]NCT07999.1 SMC-Scp complex subunit ScpB [Alphaproteobacteria bacterium]